MSRSVGIWMAMAAVAVGCSHAAAVQDDEVKHITEFRLSRQRAEGNRICASLRMSRCGPHRRTSTHSPANSVGLTVSA